MSVLVYESRREADERAVGCPRARSRDAVDATLRLWAELEADEQRHGLALTREPDLGFVWPIVPLGPRRVAGPRCSASGARPDRSMPAGDFVRWARQVLDLLGQLAAVGGAELAGDRAGGDGRGAPRRGGHGRYGLARAGRYDLYDVFDPESAGRAGLRALQHAAGAAPARPTADPTGPAAGPGMVAAPPPPAGPSCRTRPRARSGSAPACPPRPGAPGSSRAQAAAVQPPGYGLDAGDPEPPPPPAPVEDPRVARRVALVGALLVAAVLLAGGGAALADPARATSTRPPCSGRSPTS